MQFNLDPNKQANEVIFFRKLVSNYLLHPLVKFNNNNITKKLRVFLNSNLNFNILIDQKIKKCNKIIDLMKRLSVYLPRKALLTIYKSDINIRPHLEYSHILYDNENF